MPRNALSDHDRWQAAWCFLSSSSAREFSKDLWLDFIPLGQSLDWILDELKRPAEGADFEAVHQGLLNQFERRFGSAAALALVVWVDYVFVRRSTDRISESLWLNICQKRYHAGRSPGSILAADQALGRELCEIGSDAVAYGRQLDARIGESAFAADSPNLVSSVMDAETLRATVALISKQNAFCVSWERRMAAITKEALSGLFASEYAKMSSTFGPGVDQGLLGFPGSWMAALVARARSS